MTDARLRDDVVAVTQALIRIDTSNPPGRETAAARYLADYLTDAGVHCELAGPDPERLNLVARLEGRGTGPSLMLMGHTDVVPASDSAWTAPPFDAVIRDNTLVGRGAADMKGELAARTVAMAETARSGKPPNGDVVLVAASDEEGNTANDVGMSWLARNRPDLRCDLALNEGGGFRLELANGKHVVTVAVGERQVAALRLRVLGRAGHPSLPALADNPLPRAAEAVRRLSAYETPLRIAGTVRHTLDLLGAPPDPDEAISWASDQHALLPHLIGAMGRMTITPTGLHTSEPANVIPPYVDVICDCRALPGQTLSDVRAHVEHAIGNDIAYELDVIEPLTGGSLSTTESPLYEACADYVESRLPGATVLPVLCSGFTDSHWVRNAYGTVAYGFAPVFATDPLDYLRGMHNVDERLEISDLVEMTEFHLYAIGTLHE